MSMTIRGRHLLLCLALLPVTALAEAAGDVLPGQKTMLENARTITDYYDNLREQLNLEEPSPVDAAAAGDDVAPSGTPVPLAPVRPLATVEVAPLNPDYRAGFRNGHRDPFSPTDRLLQASLGGSGGGVQFQPLSQAAKIPRMHLRGLIKDDNGGIAALLEIENSGIHIVREGDTVGLYEMGVNSVIQVRRINRLNLLVEAGSLGQIIIVR